MAKVYVLNDLNRDISDASRFGEVVIVTEGQLPIFKTDIVARLLHKKLENFNIDEDMLLISGPAVICMQAVLYVARPDKRVKVLMYDVKQGKYFLRHIQ